MVKVIADWERSGTGPGMATAMPHYANVDGSMSMAIGDNGLLPELCIAFHLHYI